MRLVSRIGKALKRAALDFGRDDCPTFAAALAYYAAFSLPALLFLVVALVSRFVLGTDIERRVIELLAAELGASVALQLQGGLRVFQARVGPDAGGLAVSGAILLFAATGVLVQLQNALNRVWRVGPHPRRGDIATFFFKRALSLGMILVLSALMFASVLAGAVLAVAGEWIDRLLPSTLSEALLRGLDWGAAFALFLIAFAAIFRFLPEARVRWRDALVGAVLTALLLSVGKIGVGLYLGSSRVTETFGAAGALAVLLLWVYYSSMIVLFGAEFTHAWGLGAKPSRGSPNAEKLEPGEDPGPNSPKPPASPPCPQNE